MFHLRQATPSDVPYLCELLHAYVQETFGQSWHGSPEAIMRDGFGAEFEMVVAETGDGLLMGFAAWRLSYDLHHCVQGGEVIDLFVQRDHRGRGIAAALLTAVAEVVQRRDGKYVKGKAVEGAAPRRLYGRVARCFPGAEYIIGGRAFRQLAALAGQGLRDVVRGLPQKPWNDEP